MSEPKTVEWEEGNFQYKLEWGSSKYNKLASYKLDGYRILSKRISDVRAQWVVIRNITNHEALCLTSHAALLKASLAVTKAAATIKAEDEAEGVVHDPECIMCAALLKMEAAIAGAEVQT